MFCSRRSTYADQISQIKVLLFFWDGPFDAAKCHWMNFSEHRFLLTLTTNLFLPDADVNAHKSWQISNRCATFTGIHNKEAFLIQE